MKEDRAARVPAERLGAEIQRRMELLKINYDDLARLTGIGRSKLQRIAVGDRLQWLHPDELDAIAEALGTTSSELLRAAGYKVVAIH